MGEEPIFNYDEWEPGYTDVACVKIGNEGTLALKYQLDIIVDGDAGELADVIDVYYVADEEARTTLPTSTEGMEYIGTLSTVLNSAGEDGVAHGNLVAGEADFATIALHMQENAGNEYQDASIGTTFDIVLNATQLTHETDGFGNDQYDADAQYPIIDQAQAINVIKDDTTKDVEIASNITIKQDTERFNISSDKNINFNGNTVTRESGTGNGLVIGERGYNPHPVTVNIENANFISETTSAAVRVESGSTATFRNSTFSGREALQAYAAEEGEKTTLVFENCSFIGEVSLATASGGGREYDVTFRDCTFTGTFGNGGASVSLGAQSYGSVTLENCNIDIEYTGNAVCGIKIGSYKGSNGNNEITVTLRNTNIKINKSASASGGIFGPNEGSPVSINSKDITTLNIEEGCTFLMNGVEKVYDQNTKGWVNKQ